MRQSSRIDGPVLLIQTWRDLVDTHNMVWFAKVGKFQPETPLLSDATACVEARTRLPDAIRAAAAKYLRRGRRV